MARIRQKTSTELLTHLRQLNSKLCLRVIEKRVTYPDIIDMTRREAKKLQEKALLSIVREELSPFDGRIYKIK